MTQPECQGDDDMDRVSFVIEEAVAAIITAP
jgi:hypothetical protein